MDTEETLSFNNIKEWREWLKTNAQTNKGIWLKFYKKSTGKQAYSYQQALDEALCFGWIDSMVKKIDSESFMYRYTPRRKKSKWSETNKIKVLKLISENRMSLEAMQKIDWLKD